MSKKIKYLRLLVRWRKIKRSFAVDINNKITTNDQKVIRLWKLLIKDEDSKLLFNNLDIRQIEKENIFMMLQNGYSGNNILTLIDGRNIYELCIPKTFLDKAIMLFDNEIQKRMNQVENDRRTIIETDIDLLIKKQEKLIVKQN